MIIDNKLIENYGRVFIIAEAGVNHNGDIKLAKKLIDAALESGVDAVKFQTFKSEKLVTKKAVMADYQKTNIGKEESQYEMLKRLEVSFEDFKELKAYCHNKGIIFLSTPFDFKSADFLNEIGISAFKISSSDLTNLPLIERIAQFNKPIILSSGMATMGEIEEAVNAIKNIGNEEIAVLHCTSNYPASKEKANLKVISTLREAFGVIAGYSDHTEGTLIPSAAAVLGSAIIEKHFTLDKNMDGPDHKASLEPDELKKMVNEIRVIEKALGNGIKTCIEEEINTKQVARKSIVAARRIAAGEIIAFEDLDFKRPENGMKPSEYKKIVGRKARVEIDEEEVIDFGMFY